VVAISSGEERLHGDVEVLPHCSGFARHGPGGGPGELGVAQVGAVAEHGPVPCLGRRDAELAKLLDEVADPAFAYPRRAPRTSGSSAAALPMLEHAGQQATEADGEVSLGLDEIDDRLGVLGFPPRQRGAQQGLSVGEVSVRAVLGSARPRDPRSL